MNAMLSRARQVYNSQKHWKVESAINSHVYSLAVWMNLDESSPLIDNDIVLEQEPLVSPYSPSDSV
jgi:hypothetical protein